MDPNLFSGNEFNSDIERYQVFRQVFDTDEGRKVFREILSWCHLLKPSVQGVPIDPYLTHVREGERNIGLRLTHTLSTEPQEKKAKRNG